MNTSFYRDLDTNFEEAYKMVNQEFSHDELLEMLQSGNIPQKQIATLKLETIENQFEADILVNNLTGCDGKIREAVALKINQITTNDPTKIIFFNQAEVFAEATIDINGNICRLVIDSVSLLKQNIEFRNPYITKILGFIDSAFSELDKVIFRDKKYVINKQIFKLYWCLETLKLFVDEVDKELLLNILTRASQENEYTIKEKIAQILIMLEDNRFNKLKNELQNYENYYVRRVFIQK